MSIFKKLFILTFSIPLIGHAQQTCASRKEAEAPTFFKYALRIKNDAPKREIVLRCTGQEDIVKVALRDKKTGRILQSFEVSQAQTYLEALTPDLDNDGYSDLVLVEAWGSLNMIFKAWRYEPARDRLKIVLPEGAGTEFVRTKSGDIVTYAKGGADSWGYTLFKWKNNRLVQAYVVEEKIGVSDSSQCTYHDVSHSQRVRRVKHVGTLRHLKRYCGIGSAGLVQQGKSLLDK